MILAQDCVGCFWLGHKRARFHVARLNAALRASPVLSYDGGQASVLLLS